MEMGFLGWEERGERGLGSSILVTWGCRELGV